MSSCPSREQLQGLLAGTLSGDVEQRLSTHVETCGPCQHLLDELTGCGPALPSSGARRPPSSASCPKLSDDQLHRLRHLLPPCSSADAASPPHGRTSGGPGAAREVPEGEWPHIPGYEVIRVLGRGGMAVVY